MTTRSAQAFGQSGARLQPLGACAEAPAAAQEAPPGSNASTVRRLALPPLIVLALISLAGVPYYTAPIAERVRHPFHAWLKPSGFIGQSAGILTLALFVFMWLYPLRKRMTRFVRGGSLKVWLDIHIVAGLIVPVAGAVHAGWRFGGLIGLGYLAMLVVSLSGIAGRYLYLRIPRSRSGLELTRDEVEGRRADLVQRIAETTRLETHEVEFALALRQRSGESLGLAATVTQLLAGDLVRWRAIRTLRKRWAENTQLDTRAISRTVRLASREIALTQQMLLLDATQRVFRFWHVAHLPFAITAFAAVLIHVVVVVALGVTWLW